MKKPAGTDRFSWSDGDIIPLEPGQMLELPGGYDLGPAWRNTQPQPLEPGYAVERPPLPSGKLSGASLEEAVRLLAAWLAKAVDFTREVEEANRQWAAAPDGELDDALARNDTIYADELAALAEGNSNRLAGGEQPWTGVADCLRTGVASPGFLKALATLVECNALQSRAAVSKEVGTIGELRARSAKYAATIEHEYAETKPKPTRQDCQRWANAVIALEEMRDGETFDKAQTRVGNKVARAGQAAKITARIHEALADARRCVVVPRP